MANINSTVAVASASGLTTGFATQFFTQTDMAAESLLAEVSVTAAAETGTATVAGFTMSGYEGGLVVVPTRAIVVCVAPLSFVAGSSPAVTAQILVNSTGQETAVTLGASGVLVANAGVLLAPTATAAAPINLLTKSGDAIKVSLVPTGSPTSWSGAFKVLMFGTVVPV